MSSPTAPSTQLRSHRRRTALAFLAAATAVAGAAWLTPRKPRLAPGGPSQSAGTADLQARLASRHLLRGVQETYVAISMSAPDTGRARRVPASVAIVLDTSGSMADYNRLEDAKAAALSLVDRLGPEDELALVTYSTGAELILPLSSASDEARAQARRAIAGMIAAGGTNISGGLDLGAQALATAHRSVRRVVLISDGEPTEGLREPERLIALAGRRAADGPSITTVGVGLSFREELMAGIASAGRGNYHFVERTGDLTAMFERELGSLGETVYTDGALALTPGPGVEILDALGYPLVRDGDGLRVPVSDLRRGERRKVVLRVRVDATRASQEVVAVTWRFRTVAGVAGEQKAWARAAVTDDPAVVEAGRDADAVELIEAARTARALDEASAAYAAGDAAGASQILFQRREAYRAQAGLLGDDTVRKLDTITGDVERGFATAPAPSAAEGQRAVKGARATSFELAH